MLQPVVRILLLASGTLCVVLGLIGIFVPVLPTTPFLLLGVRTISAAGERVKQ